MSSNIDTPGKTPTKKPYHEPQLVVYGDIREITRTIQTPTGNLDGQVFRRTQLRTGGQV